MLKLMESFELKPLFTQTFKRKLARSSVILMQVKREKKEKIINSCCNVE